MTYDVDLFVIGGGSGGVRAARIAAGYGAKVMLAEEYRMGGTCVIRGCVPKKLMVYASRFSDDFEDATGFGWTVPQPSFDWHTLIANKDKEIARLEGLYRGTLEKAGVTICNSRAIIRNPHAVELVATHDIITARHILVAVGAQPVLEPVIPGGELGITSNEIFDLQQQPQRILVVGGGYIAVEFAGIFQGLNSQVTLLHRGDKLLRGFDDDIRDRLVHAYDARGMTVKLNQTLESLHKTPKGIQATFADGSNNLFDQVLVATGRRPNTSHLGLEHAGIRLGENGVIPVDGFSQTMIPSIHAVGDVTNRANLTPVAIREGHAFADRVFGGKPRMVDYSLIPTAVFSTPEIGVVGMTEAGARQKHDIQIFTSSFRPSKATLSGRDERTFMKLIVDRPTNMILGAHMIGEGAGEMIQLLGIALSLKATKADFDNTMAVHPTAAEEWVTMR